MLMSENIKLRSTLGWIHEIKPYSKSPASGEIIDISLRTNTSEADWK